MQVLEYWLMKTGRCESIPFVTEAEAKRAASRAGQPPESVKRCTVALYESSLEYEEVSTPAYKAKALSSLSAAQKQALGLEQ